MEKYTIEKFIKIYTKYFKNLEISFINKKKNWSKTSILYLFKTRNANIPASIKKEARESVQGNVLFNTDAKEEFSKLLGDGYTSGNIVVIPND